MQKIIETIELPYTYVSGLKLLDPENAPRPFMAGLLLTEPSAAVLVKNKFLKPENLITVKSEHHFGPRIHGVTFNIFTNPNQEIGQFVEQNKQFNRFAQRLYCWEIYSPGMIEEIVKLSR